MTDLIKVAWIRNDVPPGYPAPGHLHCPCGNSPESMFHPEQGDVVCNCGRVYSWNGWIKEEVADGGAVDPDVLEALGLKERP